MKDIYQIVSRPIQSWTWIGLDWVRSFVRFMVFLKTEAPSYIVFSFVQMHFWLSITL